MGGASEGTGGGQIQVGQRRGALAPGSVGVRKTASRVPGWAPQVTRDVVSGGFTEAVQFFGDGSVRSSRWR